MCVDDGQGESQEKKRARKPACDFCEHVARLSAEDVIGHAATESCAKSLALRTLHEDDQDHQHGDEHVKHQEDIEQDRHRDGQYVRSEPFVNGALLSFRLV